MGTLLVRLSTLAVLLFTLTACADSPTEFDQQRSTSDPAETAPLMDDQVQGCVIQGHCVLPPISSTPCDPSENLDWCSDDDCMTSVFQPADQSVQSCPGGGGGTPGGGGAPPPPSDPGTLCPTADTGACPPEEESIICPQPFLGNTQPALITIAGRNHEFQFHSSATYPFTRLTAGRSPATYRIGLPTTSKDAWWIAESGTITVWCRGAWISRTLWVGTMTVLDSDLHMVMGPGHPDF